MSTLPTERSLNRMVYPVVEKSTVKPKFPVEFNTRKGDFGSLFNINKNNNDKKYFKINNYWDHKCFMLMDIITYKITIGMFGQFNTLRNISKQAFRKTKNEVEDILEHGETQYIKIRREEITKIPYFRSLSNKRIMEILKRMENCSFSGYYTYRYYNTDMNSFTSERKYIDNEKIIDEVVQDKNSFEIYLGSELAKLYILNIAQMNLDFFDINMYKLNKYSQLLYRFVKSIRKNENNKNKPVKLNIQEVMDQTNIYKTNISRSISLINKYLNNLKENGYINDFQIAKEEKGNRTYCNTYTFIHI